MAMDYKKYRWFFTSSDKLVVGGKSSEQNEFLLKKLKSTEEDYTVMHTALPGSPFSIIMSKKQSSLSDIKQTAIFTASFSRAWRQKKNKAEIHVFKLSQLYKIKGMKQGTWGIKGKIKKLKVPLELVLTKQKNKLRAVPSASVKTKSSVFLKVIPGKIDKTAMLSKLQVLLPDSFSQEELLSALPPGGIKIKK